MKILLNVIFGFVLIVLAVVLARNLIIRLGMEQGIRAATGLKLTIGNFDIGLFKPVISIKDLKLYNPEGYQDPLMANVPEIYCEYKPMDILKGQIALKALRLTLQELAVINNQAGQTNVNALKALQPKGNGPPLKFSIDDFTLNIGKVTFKDDRLSISKEFDLNLAEHYTNITDVNNLVRLIVYSTISKTSIAGVNLSTIKQNLPSILLNTITSKSNFLKGLLNNLQNQ
jgi:uncharacterized protein involved in outer membrane biogenesis